MLPEARTLLRSPENVTIGDFHAEDELHLMIGPVLRSGIVAPKPAHGFGKDHSAVFERVAAFTKDELVIVHPVGQRSSQILVRDRPAPEYDIYVLCPRLQEHPHRFALGLADHGG